MVVRVVCESSGGIADIEVTGARNTSLRYDAASGQFVYNLKTPRQPGNCYRVTATTPDVSSLSAFLELKGSAAAAPPEKRFVSGGANVIRPPWLDC